ncbi:MAG: LytTR family DNA-binding domain-containing protein [Bacteroidales bacterium]|nr:LytTR family DNA-binding domain-containing protein [Bacteroidales bacterium]
MKKYKSQMLRTIIIDDEAHMRQTLEKLVKQFCPNIKLVATADGVKTGVEAIKKYNPDLILLDIKMNDGTGFDLLKQLEPVDFKVIFITAYNQYAIKAFKFSALDYLLKPVDPDELAEAVNRAEQLVLKELHKQLGVLANNMQTENSSLKKIILKTFDNIHLVKIQDIIYCKSEGSYTVIYISGGKKIMVSNTLKDYDEILSEYGFFRSHKSYLINLIHIDRFEKADGGTIVLNNEIKLPVASRKKDQLLEMFERISEN